MIVHKLHILPTINRSNSPYHTIPYQLLLASFTAMSSMSSAETSDVSNSEEGEEQVVKPCLVFQIS